MKCVPSAATRMADRPPKFLAGERSTRPPQNSSRPNWTRGIANVEPGDRIGSNLDCKRACRGWRRLRRRGHGAGEPGECDDRGDGSLAWTREAATPTAPAG